MSAWAIYALEQIATDLPRPRDQATIVEVLCISHGSSACLLRALCAHAAGVVRTRVPGSHTTRKGCRGLRTALSLRSAWGRLSRTVSGTGSSRGPVGGSTKPATHGQRVPAMSVVQCQSAASALR